MASASPNPDTILLPTVPQKRGLEDEHIPIVSSPLNPDFPSSKTTRTQDKLLMGRTTREKKESLKKRESKGSSAAVETRGTPDRHVGAKQSVSKNSSQASLAPLRYKLPAPKATDFEAPGGPQMTSHHERDSVDGTRTQFFEATEHVYNRKGFRYTHCIADPKFPSTLYYRQSETAPFCARVNFEDTSSHILFDKSARQITTEKGFRMARANVGVREGRWYWECKITSGIPKRKRNETQLVNGVNDNSGHVRVGWARREAALDAPVGFDAYSYGLRDVGGQRVHMSRPKDFFPAGEEIREGDVVGLEINLPSLSLHRKVVEGHYNPAVDAVDEIDQRVEAPNIVRDRVPIRYKAHLYFEQFEYHPTKELEEFMNPSPVISSTGGIVGSNTQKPSPTHPVVPLRTLPHSSIKVYKNGQLIGTAFEDLFTFLPPASKPLAQVGARDGLDDGMLGYFPAISVFRSGAAEANFGPDFWYPPPGYLHDEDEDVVDMIGGEEQKPLPPKLEAGLQAIRAISERYDEQIAEDIIYDLIDEVDFWVQDGGEKGTNRDIEGTVPAVLGPVDPTASDVDALAQGVGGSGEIKEIVQEEE